MSTTHYYLPVEADQVPYIVASERVNRVGFTRKALADMTPPELRYTAAMMEAPVQKDARHAAFLAAYAQLVAEQGVTLVELA